VTNATIAFTHIDVDPHTVDKGSGKRPVREKFDTLVALGSRSCHSAPSCESSSPATGSSTSTSSQTRSELASI